jgi:hypothetical protein
MHVNIKEIKEQSDFSEVRRLLIRLEAIKTTLKEEKISNIFTNRKI